MRCRINECDAYICYVRVRVRVRVVSLNVPEDKIFVIFDSTVDDSGPGYSYL